MPLVFLALRAGVSHSDSLGRLDGSSFILENAWCPNSQVGQPGQTRRVVGSLVSSTQPNSQALATSASTNSPTLSSRPRHYLTRPSSGTRRAKSCDLKLQGLLAPAVATVSFASDGERSAADSGRQICARLVKALLQRLGVAGSAHEGQLFLG